MDRLYLYYIHPDEVKHKILIPHDSVVIDWVKKTIVDGFVVLPCNPGTSMICFFDDVGYMMYLLKWK